MSKQVAKAAGAAAIERTPYIIAAEIRSIDSQARKVVFDSAVEIGKRLHEAKALVAHGEWGTWLESNVSYSQSTANNFMRVSTEYADANPQTFGNLSYSQAVALLSVPAEEREAFVEENKVEDMSARELAAAIKEKQELEKQLQAEQERQAEQKKKFDEWAQKQAAEKEALDQKLKEELQQREKIQVELLAAKEQAEKAEKAGTKADPKLKVELRKAEKAAAESQQRIAELEASLEAKVKEREEALQAEAAKKEEEIRRVAVEREEAAEKKVAEMSEQLRKNNNVAGITVKLQYETLVKSFEDLMVSVGKLEPDQQKVVKARIATLCDEIKASAV